MNPSRYKSVEADRRKLSRQRRVCNGGEWCAYSTSEFTAPGWRLYAATSDSAVAAYEYGLPPPRAYPPPAYVPQRRSRRGDNFASLPPVGDGPWTEVGRRPSYEPPESQNRRFSDPGLNNADETDSSGGESPTTEDGASVTNESLVEEMTELRAQNERLRRDLERTTADVRQLRTEVTAIAAQNARSESFSIAQMVKEIRDAAQVRENILYSKIEAMLDKSTKPNVVPEIESMKKRLFQIEFQLEQLKVHSKVENKRNMNGDASIDEKEKLCFGKNNKEKTSKSSTNGSQTDLVKNRNGYQDEESSRHLSSSEKDLQDSPKDADSQHSLCPLDNEPHSLSNPSDEQWVSSLSTCESLSSSLGPESLHAPRVTLCGPVTDL